MQAFLAGALLCGLVAGSPAMAAQTFKVSKEDHKLDVGYQTKKAADATMADDIAARIPGRFDKKGYEYDAVKPFLYSNRGIMGNMEELASPSGINPHDHPIAERHVRHFLQIVQMNRPGAWRTVRR